MSQAGSCGRLNRLSVGIRTLIPSDWLFVWTRPGAPSTRMDRACNSAVDDHQRVFCTLNVALEDGESLLRRASANTAIAPLRLVEKPLGPAAIAVGALIAPTEMSLLPSSRPW